MIYSIKWVILGIIICLAAPGIFNKNVLARDWQEEFDVGKRNLSSTGESTFFILKPGFQIVLESSKMKLVITVLDETKEIGGITTRVVEEREEKNGELYEVARNYFAIDQESGDVFYFGEDVDFYKKGKIVRHSGAWLAYENVAMDRAEIVSTTATFETPAGEFQNCLRTKESSKIKKFFFFSPKEYKTYAPGIGLIQDEKLKLVSYGYIKEVSIHKE
jgi:hypothetical protein